MKYKVSLLSFIFFTLFILGNSESVYSSEKTALFISGQKGYHTYRIPAMVVTKKGTVLAFCEGRKYGRADTGEINTLLKRSEDNGKTWSDFRIVWEDNGNVCGNPCAVVDQDTGTIWLLSTWNRGDDPEREIRDGTSTDTRRVFVCYSNDDGRSWSRPKEITSDVKKKHWNWYATGPGAGIQLRQGKHKGRLLIPCDHMIQGDDRYWSHVIYSDDHGKTWKLGGSAGEMNNECEVVELADGTLMLNMRNWKKRSNRVVATSNDAGLSWSDTYEETSLIDPRCQGSIRRYSLAENGDRNRILFLNSASDKRENMTIRISYDEGKSWAVSKVLHQCPSAYSCLAVLQNGEIGCLYEAGISSPYESIVFEKFSLEWLESEGEKQSQKTGQFFNTSDLFVSGGNVAGQRVPRLIVTNNGTIIAFSQAKIGKVLDAGIETYVAIRRSFDNGNTWEEAKTIPGDGSPIIDRTTGRIFLMFFKWPLKDGDGNPMHENWMIAHPAETRQLGGRVLLYHSDDDGETWSGPHDMSDSLWMYKNGGLSWCIGKGIQLEHGPHKGRLVIPARFFGAESKGVDEHMHNTVIYSDDHGETWHYGGGAQKWTGEACIVELSDGSIYMNNRPETTGYRSWCISHDSGETFSEFGVDKTLIESRCHEGITRFPYSMNNDTSTILFCNPATKKGRHSMTVYLSDDECKTWKVSRLIDAGPSAYSDICVANDGTILCAYESGNKLYETIRIAHFNLKWLFAGK